jgi:uncharacterized protein YjbI with pentapeptide repeats
MSINQETSFKVISSRVPLGLEEFGYGPDGSLTRGQWRQLCIDKLSSPEERSIWLTEFHQLPSSSHFNQKFDVLITFEDGSTETISLSGLGDCLDFTAADIDLGGIVLSSTFHRKTFFTGSTFHGPADFSNTVFSEPVNLSYAEFIENASFVRCKFEKGGTFVRARSAGGIAFNGATFSGTPAVTYLGQTSYAQFTDFSDSTFGSAGFENTVFITRVKFKGATFQTCSFQKAIFNQAPDFSEVKIKNRVLFFDVQFAKAANFTNADLAGASFRGSNFEDQAIFKLARFTEISGFNEVQFNGGVSFENACFGGRAAFHRSNFRIRCNFQEAQFDAEAIFENSNFHVVGHFENAIFNTWAPSFRGCAIDTTRLEFSDQKHFTITNHSEDTIKSLGFLKRLSDEHGQTDQALNFNALELRSKRLNEKASDTAFKVVTWCYEKFSDYGRSISRPVISYILLSFFTFMIALGCSSLGIKPKDCDGNQWKFFSDLERTNAPCAVTNAPSAGSNSTSDPPKLYLSGYRAAFEYTINRATGLIDFSESGKATDAIAQRLFGQPIEPFLWRAFGLFKALTSAVLLFLIALGLRNRYRIK